MPFHTLPPEFLNRCRSLRKNTTDAENFLWIILRNRALNGLKFRRQHPCEGYILDFYCQEVKLAVELDGSQHAEDRNIQYDEERTRKIASQGIEVIRFWNEEVLTKTEEVLGVIWEAACARQGGED